MSRNIEQDKTGPDIKHAQFCCSNNLKISTFYFEEMKNTSQPTVLAVIQIVEVNIILLISLQ